MDFFYFFATTAIHYPCLTSLSAAGIGEELNKMAEALMPFIFDVIAWDLSMFFSPKLETCCESRCLLTPCLLSQRSKHKGMFANLMGFWHRPSPSSSRVRLDPSPLLLQFQKSCVRGECSLPCIASSWQGRDTEAVSHRKGDDCAASWKEREKHS